MRNCPLARSTLADLPSRLSPDAMAKQSRKGQTLPDKAPKSWSRQKNAAQAEMDKVHGKMNEKRLKKTDPFKAQQTMREQDTQKANNAIKAKKGGGNDITSEDAIDAAKARFKKMGEPIRVIPHDEVEARLRKDKGVKPKPADAPKAAPKETPKAKPATTKAAPKAAPASAPEVVEASPVAAQGKTIPRQTPGRAGITRGTSKPFVEPIDTLATNARTGSVDGAPAPKGTSAPSKVVPRQIDGVAPKPTRTMAPAEAVEIPTPPTSDLPKASTASSIAEPPKGFVASSDNPRDAQLRDAYAAKGKPPGPSLDAPPGVRDAQLRDAYAAKGAPKGPGFGTGAASEVAAEGATAAKGLGGLLGRAAGPLGVALTALQGTQYLADLIREHASPETVAALEEYGARQSPEGAIHDYADQQAGGIDVSKGMDAVNADTRKMTGGFMGAQGAQESSGPHPNSDFGKAFRAARDNGDQLFPWNGKSYTTRFKEETPEQFNAMYENGKRKTQ